MRKPRQYPVPKVIRGAFTSDSVTLDEMELVSLRPSEAGAWAAKVLARENDRLLASMLGEDTRLPRGVLAEDEDGDEVVVALMASSGQIWNGSGWVDPEVPVMLPSTIALTEGDVAFVARAMAEGADGVVFQPTLPLAFIAAASGEPEPPDSDLPEHSVVVAVVDPLDKGAVLEMIAISPGPQTFRRHGGGWHPDKAWVSILKSVSPPPMVKLEEGQVASVTAQVDTATQDSPFEETDLEEAQQQFNIRAGGYLDALRHEADENMLALNIALVAVAGKELSPKDVANTEKLRRYWLFGRGAAKIRWFTPGAWRRCHRHLVKYLGPKMTPGYCTNLSKRLGGPGVATHVGD